MDSAVSESEWDALTRTEQWEYVQLLEKQAQQLDEILSLFPCPEHDRCIPHALARIATLEHIYAVHFQQVTQGLTHDHP